MTKKTEPIFKSIFGMQWDNLPPVMHRHYASTPYSHDVTIAEGTLDVYTAPCIKWLKPFFNLLGSVPLHTEKNVPVTVHFRSAPDTKCFCFDRNFHFRNGRPYRFVSHMEQRGEEVTEIMKFGLGWRMNYLWQDNKVILAPIGFCLSIFNRIIPLPLSWLIGTAYAEEEAIDDTHFRMFVEIRHPLLGRIYEYKGQFEMIDHNG